MNQITYEKIKKEHLIKGTLPQIDYTFFRFLLSNKFNQEENMTKEKMNELYEKSQEIVAMMEELGIKEYKGYSL